MEILSTSRFHPSEVPEDFKYKENWPLGTSDRTEYRKELGRWPTE